jgi:hypothetical protein
MPVIGLGDVSWSVNKTALTQQLSAPAVYSHTLEARYVPKHNQSSLKPA